MSAFRNTAVALRWVERGHRTAILSSSSASFRLLPYCNSALHFLSLLVLLFLHLLFLFHFYFSPLPPSVLLFPILHSSITSSSPLPSHLTPLLFFLSLPFPTPFLLFLLHSIRSLILSVMTRTVLHSGSERGNVVMLLLLDGSANSYSLGRNCR